MAEGVEEARRNLSEAEQEALSRKVLLFRIWENMRFCREIREEFI